METVAGYWWLWLLGFLISLSIAAWYALINFIGAVKDGVEVTSKTHEAFGTLIGDETRTTKAMRVSGIGLGLLRDKIKDRMARIVALTAFVVTAAVFGSLLVVSIVVNCLAYYQAK